MSPNLSSGHFAKNKLIYEQVIYNTLTLVGLATTLNAAEARRYRYTQLHVVQCLITHACCIAAGVDIASSRVYLFVCLSVCPRSKRKTA